MQKAKRPSIQKRHSTHRGQRDLLSSLQDLTKAFQAFQPQDLPRAFQYFPGIPAARPSTGIPVIHDIPDIPVIHDFQSSVISSSSSTSSMLQHLPVHPSTFQCYPVPSSAIQYLPVHPGIPPHSSILQLECILYIFYTSTGFH